MDTEINRVLAKGSLRLANDTVPLANDTEIEGGEWLGSCVYQYTAVFRGRSLARSNERIEAGIIVGAYRQVPLST